MRFLLPQWKCTDRAPSAWPPVRPTPSARPPQPRKGGGSACPWPPGASEIPAGFMICTLEVVVSNMITKRVRTIFLASFAMESPIWLTRFWACPRRSGGAIVTGVVLFNFFLLLLIEMYTFSRAHLCSRASRFEGEMSKTNKIDPRFNTCWALQYVTFFGSKFPFHGKTVL